MEQIAATKLHKVVGACSHANKQKTATTLKHKNTWPYTRHTPTQSSDTTLINMSI